MDCIDLFKRAAVALQTDPRYLALDQARKANDKQPRHAAMTQKELDLLWG